MTGSIQWHSPEGKPDIAAGWCPGLAHSRLANTLVNGMLLYTLFAYSDLLWELSATCTLSLQTAPLHQLSCPLVNLTVSLPPHVFSLCATAHEPVSVPWAEVPCAA